MRNAEREGRELGELYLDMAEHWRWLAYIARIQMNDEKASKLPSTDGSKTLDGS